MRIRRLRRMRMDGAKAAVHGRTPDMLGQVSREEHKHQQHACGQITTHKTGRKQNYKARA